MPIFSILRMYSFVIFKTLDLEGEKMVGQFLAGCELVEEFKTHHSTDAKVGGWKRASSRPCSKY